MHDARTRKCSAFNAKRGATLDIKHRTRLETLLQ